MAGLRSRQRPGAPVVALVADGLGPGGEEEEMSCLTDLGLEDVCGIRQLHEALHGAREDIPGWELMERLSIWIVNAGATTLAGQAKRWFASARKGPMSLFLPSTSK